MKFKYSDSYDPEMTKQFGAILRWFVKLVGFIAVISLIEFFATGAVSLAGWIGGILVFFLARFAPRPGQAQTDYSFGDVIEVIERRLKDSALLPDWDTYLLDGESDDPFLKHAWLTCRECDWPLSESNKIAIIALLENLKAERGRRQKY